jgi:hypothetical protein
MIFRPSIWICLALSVAMIAYATATWFLHDSKHRDLDAWVDYGFSRETLRHALLYYRFMALSSVIFYVLFTVSCLLLQSEGTVIFKDDTGPVIAGPIGTALFSLDLVLRGAFFDFMQHFDLRLATVQMNRKAFWFVWYAFVFRMYYGLILLRVLASFAWIWTKIRLVRQRQGRGDYTVK